MTRIQPGLGRVVRSRAGRDSGRLFLVVGILDGEHLLLADGDLRRVEKPKKKKTRHLEATAYCCECPAIGKLNNSDIRKLIQNATDKEG